VAQRQHAVWSEHIEQFGDDFGGMLKQSVGGMVSLAPITDEPGFEKSEHVGVLAQHGAELIEMSEYASQRSVGRILRAGVVQETADHLEARVAGGGEIGADSIEHCRRKRSVAEFGEKPVHVHQGHRVVARATQLGRIQGLRIIVRVVTSCYVEATLGISEILATKYPVQCPKAAKSSPYVVPRTFKSAVYRSHMRRDLSVFINRNRPL